MEKVAKADVSVQANHFPALNLKVAVGNPSHDGKTIMNVVATFCYIRDTILWKNDIKNNIETKMSTVILPFQTLLPVSHVHKHLNRLRVIWPESHTMVDHCPVIFLT